MPQWMAIHASGLAVAISNQPSTEPRTSNGTEVCVPLTILLDGIEWKGRKMKFSLDKVDIVAFLQATEELHMAVPPNPHMWGFPEWWHPSGWVPGGTAVPRWWYNPPTEVVSSKYRWCSTRLMTAIGSTTSLFFRGPGGMA